MNKKLLAAAIGLAFAGVAQAQTNVTLYGIVDGGLRFDKTAVGTLHNVNSGSESGSRWGIRGTEDLGDGLKANFVLEQGFDIANNSVPQGNTGAVAGVNNPNISSTGSRFFSREATVGLSGGFGSVKLGRAYNSYYNTWVAADPFGAGLVGQATNLALGPGGLRAGTTTATTGGSRFDNGLYYETPVYAGFKGALSYQFGGSTTNDTLPGDSVKNGGNAYTLALTYASGPIYAGYAHADAKNNIDTNTTKANTLVGSYDLTVAKIHALYFTGKNDAGTFDARSYYLGVTVPVNAWTFLAGGGHLDDRVTRATGSNDANFFGLGATYAFSKRTDVYFSAARMTNKNNSQYVITDASTNGLYTANNVTAGFDPSSYQIGLRHKF